MKIFPGIYMRYANLSILETESDFLVECEGAAALRLSLHIQPTLGEGLKENKTGIFSWQETESVWRGLPREFSTQTCCPNWFRSLSKHLDKLFVHLDTSLFSLLALRDHSYFHSYVLGTTPTS